MRKWEADAVKVVEKSRMRVRTKKRDRVGVREVVRKSDRK